MLHVLTRVAEIHCGDIEASLEHTALRFGQCGNNLPSGNIVLPEFERPTRYTLTGRGMWVESAEHRTLSSCVRIVKIDMFPVDCSVETLRGAGPSVVGRSSLSETVRLLVSTKERLICRDICEGFLRQSVSELIYTSVVTRVLVKIPN